MDLRFLQTFVYVVELGSIAQTARHEGLTPASVQQRLKSLGSDIGCQLLVRSGRTVRPTVAGARILDQARKILSDVRDLKSMASETELPAGPLRLGATPTALASIIPFILKRWVDTHPHIEVYIEPASSITLYGKVLKGELDAAVIVHPLFSLPKTCEWRALRHEPMVLVTPPDMRVDDPLRTIEREPYICYDRSVVGGKLADDYLRARQIRPNIRFELDGIDSIAKLVSEDLGVSVLPDSGAMLALPGAVRKWPLPAPYPVREVGTIWMRSSVRSPLAQSFVCMALEQMPA